jgi:hypothetical protein
MPENSSNTGFQRHKIFFRQFTASDRFHSPELKVSSLYANNHQGQIDAGFCPEVGRNQFVETWPIFE